MIENYIQQLCKELEFDPPLKPQLPGVYNYPLEEELSFTITALQPTGVSFECIIGQRPKGNEEDLFRDLLHANLFGQGTRGAVLALDADGEHVKLTRHMENYLSYAQFRDAVEDFVNVIDFWRERLHLAPPPSEES